MMFSFKIATCLIVPLVFACGWQARAQTSRGSRAQRGGGASRSVVARGADFVLTQESASHFARLALRCVQKEYPNKIEHVLDDASQIASPRALHPAFYGCYDWHSSVHGHWLLAHLLHIYPQLPEAAEIRAALGANLTAENVRAEVAYINQADRQSFERPYGWAWLLKLALELREWDDADAHAWSRNLQPLADALSARYVAFLPKLSYPIRVGTHFNTAFGLSFALDYARAARDRKLEDAITTFCRALYLPDTNYPASYEPGGDDFLSSSLIEADLMRRVLQPAEFRRWFRRFLPGIAQGQPKNLLHPAEVSDRSDPKIVHLDGLNLSRAWCMRSIAAVLARTDPARRVLADAARLHASDALSHVATGNYEGEHWLASFAVLLLSTPNPD